ncbi:MAG: hypothetical protein HY835_00690, partial [Anaerolineae bacterium]|nr:hypothetical protein [Anaerolineae bacterium]
MSNIKKTITTLPANRLVLFFSLLSFAELLLACALIVARSMGAINAMFLGISLKRLRLVAVGVILAFGILLLGLRLSRQTPSLKGFPARLPILPRMGVILFSDLWLFLGVVFLIAPPSLFDIYHVYFTTAKPFFVVTALIVCQFWGMVWLADPQPFLDAVKSGAAQLIRVFRPAQAVEGAAAPSSTTPFSRLVWTLLMLGSAALLVCSVYRAATYPFTHDESLSYAGFTWAPYWQLEANNHPLNTFLMQVCAHTLGSSELSLRLPNLLAHALYLGCSLVLLRRFRHPALQVAGFVLLNLNPYQLDFFALARGYGLAIGFELLAITLLVQAHDARQRRQAFAPFLFLAALAGALAVLAIYSFVNFFLPMLLVSAWLLLSDETGRRFHPNLAVTNLFLMLTGVFVLWVGVQLVVLQQNHMLYFGGQDFFQDTLGSLVLTGLYVVDDTSPLVPAITTGMIALVMLGLFLSMRDLLVKKQWSFFTTCAVMLAGAAGLPLLQARWLGALYPVSRAALYYLPLILLLMILVMDALLQIRHPVTAARFLPVIPVLAAGLVLWSFARSYDPHTLRDWGSEAHNRRILALIDQDRQADCPNCVIKLASSWLMEPSLNFYRTTL